MDYRELAERQRWSLHQKIDHSVGVIEAFIAQTGKVPFVSYSGGKDSTVLLDLARRYVDRDMKAVFCNTGNEYPEIVRFVRGTENVTIIHPEYTIRKVLEKHGFPLISKEQAQGIRQAKTTRSEKLLNIRLHGTDKGRGWTSGKIADRWQYLIAEPFMISEKCCDCLKKRPLAKYVQQTGEVSIIGTMAGESRLRTQQYIRRGGCNSFAETSAASYPLSIWTDEDIWNYIRMFGIPYCELYDKGHARTGCMVCGFGAQYETGCSRFELLHQQHPKAYKIFMKYTNNGVTYREALLRAGIQLPE
jgi:3'-phosphoadenosine 5'-phosphosulfate sulfotransferase (PAPS reductase)/FAD synthetase